MSSSKVNNYPIEKLVQAYNILVGQGHKSFNAFVKRVDMPHEDIDRVLSKHAYNTNPEYRKKVDAIKDEIRKKVEGIGE